MPYVATGTIPSIEDLTVLAPETFKNRFEVDLRMSSEVIAVDRAAKTVTVKTEDRTYTETYDKLVVAIGTRGMVPPIPGLRGDRPSNVTTLLNAGDIQHLLDMRDAGAKRFFIIGAGFIGCELAEQLALKGYDTTLCDMMPYAMNAVFDNDMAPELSASIARTGCKTVFSAQIEAVEVEDGKAVAVHVKGRGRIETDVIVCAAGLRPNSDLVSGLELHPRGHIVTNEHMQTSDPDVYAVGDITMVNSLVLNEKVWVPLAGPAQRQGRVAAGHIFGVEPTSYAGTVGTSCVRVGDMVGALTGVNERTLQAHGYKKYCAHEPWSSAAKTDPKAYCTVYIHNPTHVGYYPGAVPMHLKLIFHPTFGTIYGAQAVSDHSATRRIDVIATAIRGGMTVMDLEDADLCYSPEFGSPKDPVAFAAMVASGVVRGQQSIIDMPMLMEHFDEAKADGIVIDLRNDDELEARNLGPGVVQIPVNQLRTRLAEVPKNVPVFVFCRVGLRGYLAQRILQQNGYDRVFNVSGGMLSHAMMKAYEEA